MPVATGETFDRDQMARWYGQRHLNTDMGVMHVFYLPGNAPPREIRLLEVNSLISEMADPEPIDFGVDIGEANGHTLYVLDITPSQWDAIQQRRMRLPAGWTLDGNQPVANR
jgi:hypothetical protein